LMTRACYQFGSLTRKKRAKDQTPGSFGITNRRRKECAIERQPPVGTVEQFKTKALAKKAVEALLLKLNAEPHGSV